MDRWIGRSEQGRKEGKKEEMHLGQVVFGFELVTLLLSIWLQMLLVLPQIET